ncbi:MAG: PP2C family protein-serine/threonine phosphatase [Anaerolineae bacterium]
MRRPVVRHKSLSGGRILRAEGEPVNYPVEPVVAVSVYVYTDGKRPRAGHNPAILAQHSTNSSTLIQPQGIALGLEAGSHFHGCLEEHELPLQSGDVLTFYTDGFTEASDATGNEFGEDRLEREISAAKERTANGIIQQVVRSVKTFVGSHPQHDDMTMVVLKVL